MPGQETSGRPFYKPSPRTLQPTRAPTQTLTPLSPPLPHAAFAATAAVVVAGPSRHPPPRAASSEPPAAAPYFAGGSRRRLGFCEKTDRFFYENPRSVF